MSNRKHSETSSAAYHSLKADEIRAIYQKIIGALQVLGMAHTEKIAEYLTMEHSKIHKRVSEMQALGIIWKPGAKLPMKSGRNGYLWQLTAASSPKTEAQINYKKVETTAAELAINLIRNSTGDKVVQQNLF